MSDKIDRWLKGSARFILLIVACLIGVAVYKLLLGIPAQRIKEGKEFLLILPPLAITLFLYILLTAMFLRDSRKSNIQILAVFLIIAAGLSVMGIMVSLRKPPEKKNTPQLAPLLSALPVRQQALQMVVTGYGTVEPRVEVQVVPQVSGRVIECHPNFINGGFFEAEEVLLRIDPRDFELAVQQAEAEVAGARVQLEQEQAEAQIALNEWKLLHPNEQPSSELVLRQPQIRSVQARLKAAEAQLQKARLDLERTQITMPFSGRVVRSGVDRGQFVVAGQAVGAVYRTDLVEITVPLENSELQWFTVPRQNGKPAPDSESGSPARIMANFAGKQQTWEGRVARTEGKVNTASRMVHVVVEVKNPFRNHAVDQALVPGMFVQVDILGRLVDSVIQVPRYAMHGPNRVWVASSNTLTIKPVRVIRMDRGHAYVVSGLADGDLVITSPLEAVTNGMKIRIDINEEEAGNGKAETHE